MLKIKLKTQSSPCFEEARNYIYSIDFSRIINKLVKHQSWLQNDAEETSELYRNFLFLKMKYRDLYKLPPSEDIDEFWHNHILDTKAYARDCQFIFGSFLHHHPEFDLHNKIKLENLDKDFKITQNLHLKEFGKYIQPTRKRFPKFIYFLIRKISR